MSNQSPSSPLYPLLIIGGIGCALAALFWWWTSRPSRTDQVTATMLGRAAPEAEIVGPLLVGGVGAFLVLIGVMLYNGRRNVTR